MKQRNILLLFLLFIIIIPIISAQFTPSGNIDGLNFWNMTNFSFVESENMCLEGNQCISSWDNVNVTNITEVNATPPYILGGGTSNSISIDFNETELNNTIDRRASILSVNKSDFWDSLDSPIDILIANLNQSGEENLSVNKSDFWDGLDDPDDIVFPIDCPGSTFQIGGNISTRICVGIPNIFDQILNTTSDVVFNELNAKNITVTDIINAVRFRYISGNNQSYTKIGDSEFPGSEEAIVFGNNGANLISGEVIFLVYAQENKTALFLQFGKNNSAGLWGNSMMIMPNDLALNAFQLDLDNTSDCIKVYNHFNKTVRLFCDTAGYGASQIIHGGLHVWRQIFGDEGFIIQKSSVIDLEGGTFTVNNGTIISTLERREEIGVTSGDLFDLQNANFEGGDLTPYTLNDSATIGVNVWTDVDDSECHDNLCASAGSSVTTEMTDVINTLNLQNLNIHFYITETNLDIADTFNIDMNNNSGSGWINIVNVTDIQGSTDVLINSSIPDAMSNFSSVSIRFTVVTNHPTNEVVWVDDIVINGTFIATTLQNVTQKDLKIQGKDSSVFLLFNDSNDRWVFSPDNVTFTSVTQVTVNVTGSIILNGTPITDWSAINITTAGIQFTGSSTKTLTLEPTTGVNITGTFTDLDSNVSTYCSGTTTYGDGDGNCDDISGVYVNVSGDTMTGNLDMGQLNITDVTMITYTNGTSNLVKEFWNSTCWVKEFSWGAKDVWCP